MHNEAQANYQQYYGSDCKLSVNTIQTEAFLRSADCDWMSVAAGHLTYTGPREVGGAFIADTLEN
jgi:hypothetical protein